MGRPFVSHIACSVGTARPIGALCQREGLGEDVVEAFRARGLRDYRDDDRGVGEMCAASALATLAEAGWAPEGVATILIASSNADALVDDDDETALWAALHDAGFARARVLGLTLQACSALGDALRVAGALAAAEAAPVLLVVFGQKRKTSRLGPQANLVFSDGAASCLVSAEAGTYEVCASESVTNTRLGAMGRAGSIAQFQGGMLELRAVARDVCARAGIDVGEVRALFGTNAGDGHLALMAQATGVAADRVYGDDVAAYSHVHSCDNLISLRNYAARTELAPGDSFLLLGWSPHVFSAAVLRYSGWRCTDG